MQPPLWCDGLLVMQVGDNDENELFGHSGSEKLVLW